MVDATSWVQALNIASKPADSATGLYGNLPPGRNVNPVDIKSTDITGTKSQAKVSATREKDVSFNFFLMSVIQILL